MVDQAGPARLSFRPRRAPAGAAPGPPEGRDGPLGLGGARDGVLYVPDTAEAGAPVLVFLHGAAGSGRAHLRAVLAAADRYGAVLVAPDSRHPGSWDLVAEGRIGPDPAFLDRVLAEVVGDPDLVVDPGRLAIGGVSDGASYALSLGLCNGDVFPTVLAFSPGFLVAPDRVGLPRVFVSHGTVDAVLPIDACSRAFVPALERAGYDVRYREFDGGHTVPGPVADEAFRWWLGGDQPSGVAPNDS
jgi:phospholipase/carboxylesterase